MTNMSSGSKRIREDGGEIREHKRPREDARDWRDVHLRSTSSKKPISRKDSYDRRDHYESDRSRRDRDEGRHRQGSHRADSREPREDYSPRRHGRSPRRHGYSPRRHSTTRTTSHMSSAAHNGEEKEEGEISPRPSPRVKTQALPPNDPKPINEPLPEMELDTVPSPPSVEETLASRRARRQAILAKYTGIASASDSVSQPSGQNSATQEHPPSTFSNKDSNINRPQGQGTNGTISQRVSLSPSPAVGDDFTLAKNDEDKSSDMKRHVEEISKTDRDQVSAADYDPSLDRREDEHKRINAPVKVEPDVEEIEVAEEDEDEDDLDDMFAVATAPKKPKARKVKKVMKPSAPALITTTTDSAADAEGYYSIILGEQLDGGRYQVFSSLGKGMFANVVRARVLQPEPDEPIGREVAIKIVRCQESMYKAGLKEVQMLNKLKQADPEDKKHIVRLERTFEHRGHLCLVFESLSMNLRDVVKRFGKDVGLNIKAVRAYAHQLFLALSLFRKVGVMHADIKPDNILVNEQKTLLKLCDLGSASDASENGITPYLVSRFYRAPEIILGVPYDPALDIWSMGCTLYELYTGKILFPGRSNNQMLLLMMELKGRFNGKMIKKAKFGDGYFDELGAFNSVERDRVTGTDVIKKVHVSKPSRDLRSRVMPPASVKMKDDENKLLLSFIDLLDRCLALDPARRITPKEALAHPFIRG